jgi:hypothetical protein
MADARTQARSAILSGIVTYNPASYWGGILTLHYARARELEPWLDLVAVRGEVIGARYLAIGAGGWWRGKMIGKPMASRESMCWAF